MVGKIKQKEVFTTSQCFVLHQKMTRGRTRQRWKQNSVVGNFIQLHQIHVSDLLDFCRSGYITIYYSGIQDKSPIANVEIYSQ